ncbi:hypothetical protein TA3x_002285 [Tundrisphaera sp. TA3]|uniref:hypothetical protein n=1 Tax=Tundrisphaera sp. TA3 TaxID=3435775 RepID=UPI003EB8A655
MTQRPYDAVLSPLSFAGPGDAASRLARLQEAFAPLLGVSRVHVRHQGDRHFLTGDPGETLLFPGTDPRSGQPRYRWAERGDGVSLGRRVDDA